MFCGLGLGAGFAAAAGQPGEANDLDSYLRAIRASGMSEMAESSLRTLAAVSTGNTLLQLYHGSGTAVGLSYTSGFCPVPGADPQATKLQQEKIQKEIAAEVEVWKPIADMDSSGFVTTMEAARTRSIAEFGLQVAMLLKEGASSLSDVSKKTGVPDSTVTRRLAEYRELSVRAARFGLRKTALPSVSLAEVSAAKP